MTKLTKLLGCKHPVILGAMGVICNPELVAAVSEAGGFGLLATAFTSDAEFLRKQIKDTKELTQNPFGANLQVMNPLTSELINILADEGVKAVTVSGGSPKTIIPLLKDKGMIIIPVVPTVDVARKSEALGVDAIIAEGSESGGIQGFRGASTMVLVPAVVDAVNVPVIAAGGIADSRGYRAALALGAAGVQVGTRFIATKECIAHQNYKNAVVDLNESSTQLINLGAFRVRALSTPFAEKLLSDPSQTGGGFSGQGIEESWLKGDMDAGFLPAGEVTGLIKDIPSVKDIIDEMIQ